MAKDREIACIHYVCEGCCNLGKEGSFRHQCQKCKSYKAVRGKKPARKDTRRHKLAEIERKEAV